MWSHLQTVTTVGSDVVLGLGCPRTTLSRPRPRPRTKILPLRTTKEQGPRRKATSLVIMC